MIEGKHGVVIIGSYRPAARPNTNFYSLSLQLGRPWMQHVDHFLRNTSTWHKQPYSVPKNDHLLVAFLQLRLIGAEKLNFWPSSFSSNLALNTQLQSHFTELEQWESTWCDDNQKGLHGHQFRFIVSWLICCSWRINWQIHDTILWRTFQAYVNF